MKTLTRRQFLNRSAAAAAVISSMPMVRAQQSANNKLNIGIVGVANQGMYNLNNVASENIVALCDVDEQFLNQAAAKFPGAATYRDFRKLLERSDLDAVVVATPDHTHAVAAVAALRSGRHVYCEKPLARTMTEVRAITEAARQSGKVTQIGTQIHAGNNYRRVVELVQSGAVGKVKEVHVWVAATYGNRPWPPAAGTVPETLAYDLWLGPIQPRPYSPDYVPFQWRNYWAFGGGALADFGCHYMDLPHWALGLTYARSAEVIDGPEVHAELTPPWLVVRFEYPPEGNRTALPLTWYHGGRQPGVDLLPEKYRSEWKSGVLFVGEKGRLLADYGRRLLLPEEQFTDFKAPEPFIPNSVGHHKEWIEACKSGGKTTCHFGYSGPLSETVLLGNVAFRSGRKVTLESGRLETGNPDVDRFIRHEYRPGWRI